MGALAESWALTKLTSPMFNPFTSTSLHGILLHKKTLFQLYIPASWVSGNFDEMKHVGSMCILCYLYPINIILLYSKGTVYPNMIFQFLVDDSFLYPSGMIFVRSLCWCSWFCTPDGVIMRGSRFTCYLKRGLQIPISPPPRAPTTTYGEEFLVLINMVTPSILRIYGFPI